MIVPPPELSLNRLADQALQRKYKCSAIGGKFPLRSGLVHWIRELGRLPEIRYRHPMALFLWTCLASGIGGGLRLLSSRGLALLLGTAFPYGTLLVNVVGSFAISLIMQAAIRGHLSPEWRLVLTTGLLGGFTTYSAFNYETLAFAEGGAWRLAAWNLGLTVVTCLASGFIGLVVARRLWVTG